MTSMNLLSAATRPASRSRLADRLLNAAHQRFVGRETPCSTFEAALSAPRLPFFVLYVYGPGGIGKTTLLHEFRYRCRRHAIPATYLDARNVEATPHAFLDALSEAMELPEGRSALEVLGEVSERQVLLIDTFEHLSSLERWLFSTFLPRLNDDVLVVLAGRTARSPAQRIDSGWETLIQTIALHNLSSEESRTYLARMGIQEAHHEAVFEFTHGHPLALTLTAAVAQQRPGTTFTPDADPNIIKALLDRFVMKVPSPAHRAALEACAMVHYLSELLLAEMVALPDAHDLFEWLRGLSFIESGPYGLCPYDLARDALAADLRWRNPDWYAELHHRARSFYNRRLSETHGRDQQRFLSDYMYLHRNNPVIKPFLDWHETGSSVPHPASEADWPILCEMVASHEGEAAARLAAYWFERQPQGVLLFRDPEGDPAGFLMRVALHEVTDDDRKTDPAIEAACRYLAAHAPLRLGESATYFRFWLARDSYQDVSAMQSLLFLKMAQHYLTTLDLAFSFLPCADPDFWAPFCAYAELERLPEADYEVDGRRYGIFGHDWRVVPPALWLDHLAQREVATSEDTVLTKPLSPEKSLIVLSEEAFRIAVHDALRGYARPHALVGNPLLRSRVVAERVQPDDEEEERIDALCTLLKTTWEMLNSSPRLLKGYRALDRAYFRPAPSQEEAADLVGLPYSTFRRHLKLGITELTDLLWDRELNS